jgi:hypothetical protein
VEVEVTVDVEVDVDVGADWFDDPHAATDSAAAPVTARTASRVRRGVGQLADINVSPNREWTTKRCTRSSCAAAV